MGRNILGSEEARLRKQINSGLYQLLKKEKKMVQFSGEIKSGAQLEVTLNILGGLFLGRKLLEFIPVTLSPLGNL